MHVQSKAKQTKERRQIPLSDPADHTSTSVNLHCSHARLAPSRPQQAPAPCPPHRSCSTTDCSGGRSYGFCAQQLCSSAVYCWKTAGSRRSGPGTSSGAGSGRRNPPSTRPTICQGLVVAQGSSQLRSGVGGCRVRQAGEHWWGTIPVLMRSKSSRCIAARARRAASMQIYHGHLSQQPCSVNSRQKLPHDDGVGKDVRGLCCTFSLQECIKQPCCIKPALPQQSALKHAQAASRAGWRGCEGGRPYWKDTAGARPTGCLLSMLPGLAVVPPQPLTKGWLQLLAALREGHPSPA